MRAETAKRRKLMKNKVLAKYVMHCEKCGATGTLFCGDCAGAQCEKCFVKHLPDCQFCHGED